MMLQQRLKERTPLSRAEELAKRFFRERGVSPTLSEFREVVSAYMNNANPMGIH
jgi:hypothetical protein